MFFTNEIEVSYENLNFRLKVPGDELLTEMFTETLNLHNKDIVTPLDFRKLASLVLPLIISFPEGWENIPVICQNRLLFDIAKYLTNEGLSIPEIKKK